MTANAKLSACFPLFNRNLVSTASGLGGCSRCWWQLPCLVLQGRLAPAAAHPGPSPADLRALLPPRPHPRQLCRGWGAGPGVQRAQARAAVSLLQGPRCPQAHGSCSVTPAGMLGWHQTQGCCSVVKPERGGGGALGGGSSTRSQSPALNKALLCSRRRGSGDGFLPPRFWGCFPLPPGPVPLLDH